MPSFCQFLSLAPSLSLSLSLSRSSSLSLSLSLSLSRSLSLSSSLYLARFSSLCFVSPFFLFFGGGEGATPATCCSPAGAAFELGVLRAGGASGAASMSWISSSEGSAMPAPALLAHRSAGVVVLSRSTRAHSNCNFSCLQPSQLQLALKRNGASGAVRVGLN